MKIKIHPCIYKEGMTFVLGFSKVRSDENILVIALLFFHIEITWKVK